MSLFDSAQTHVETRVQFDDSVDEHIKGLRAYERQFRKDAQAAARTAGKEVNEHAKAYTDRFRPPARGSIWGSGMRPAHPGKWSDIRGDLKQGHRFDVSNHDSPVLRVFNDAPHAKWVERMKDFWVVRGLMTSGLIHRAVIRALKAVAKKKVTL